jgi:hypothetical protein
MLKMLKNIISMAVKMTPTGDNSQPFSLAWKDDRAIIFHDNDLARHRLNTNNYASYIALGCLLESVRIAASSEGYDIEYQLDPVNPLSAFSIGFVARAKTDEKLLPLLQERCTDRRFYLKGWDAKVAQEISEVSKEYSPRLKIIENLPPDFKDYLLRVDRVFWDDKQIFFDTLKWIRFSEKEALATKDGLPLLNLGLDMVGGAYLWLASRFAWLHKIFSFGGIIEGRRILTKQFNSSAGFCFFYPKEKDLLSLVEVGKLGQRTWLELNSRAYAVQPITVGTLMPFVTKNYGTIHDLPKSVQELFAEGGKLHADSEIPAWGFRFGKVKEPLPKRARTYRRG